MTTEETAPPITADDTAVPDKNKTANGYPYNLNLNFIFNSQHVDNYNAMHNTVAHCDLVFLWILKTYKKFDTVTEIIPGIPKTKYSNKFRISQFSS